PQRPAALKKGHRLVVVPQQAGRARLQETDRAGPEPPNLRTAYEMLPGQVKVPIRQGFLSLPVMVQGPELTGCVDAAHEQKQQKQDHAAEARALRELHGHVCRSPCYSFLAGTCVSISCMIRWILCKRARFS